jgi:hypothetical protein
MKLYLREGDKEKLFLALPREIVQLSCGAMNLP